MRYDGGGMGRFLADYVDFLLHRKRWYLIPIAVVFGLLGLLALARDSSVVPVMYALF